MKFKFANHFIIYQKCPFRGRIVPGRLHSELCARGVKFIFGQKLVFTIQVSVEYVQFEKFKFEDTGFRIHEYLFFVFKNNQVEKIMTSCPQFSSGFAYQNSRSMTFPKFNKN